MVMSNMETIVRKIDIKRNKEKAQVVFREAASILQSGGLVAFPTETVYGLGGNAMMASASEKIYAAKGRPSDNPLIVHIADWEAVNVLAKNISQEARKLMEAFWPGPMTLIFEKKDCVPVETTGGLNTVAVRFPSHPVAMQLIREAGVYIAAPSANLSGRPSPTRAEHVIEDLSGRIDMILDGGPVDIGLESTIIDVSEGIPTILRPGYITREMINDVLGRIEVDPAILEEHVQDNLVAKAPGMKYKHYAPKGELTLVEGADMEEVVATINNLVEQAVKHKQKVAVIATEESKERYHAPVVETVGKRQDVESVAHSLFDILRRMDTLGVDVIYSESFQREDLGQAVMNRLLKAAGYHVLRLDKQK